MSVRTKDLPDLIGTKFPRPMLRCPQCGETFSADKGDYFWREPDRVFTCDTCNTELQLVTKHVTYREVK